MRINCRVLMVSAIVAGLAVPAIAAAQAIPRTTTTSEAPPPAAPPPAPPTTSSTGSVSSPRDIPPPPPQRSQPVRSAPPPRGSSGSSGSSSGSGGSSGSSTSSGSSGSGSSAILRGGANPSSGPRGTGVSDAGTYVGAGSRTRDGRPITNIAVRRTTPIGGAGGVNVDWIGRAGYPFSPWGRWYPWYSGGWGYGYVSYDPWRVGGTRWVWGRYGMWWYEPTPWYDPWYDPWFMYGYDSSFYYGAYGVGGYGSRSNDAPHKETGSIRLRVSPDKAKVFIDGVLQGTVDDFNGLGSHLDVAAGAHQLELRADGYVTLKDEIVVEGGKTQTYRGTLKKSSK